MNNTQFYILLGVTLGGVLWQRLDYYHLSGRIDQLGARIDQLTARIDQIESELRQFYQTLGRHEEAIDTIKTRLSK